MLIAPFGSNIVCCECDLSLHNLNTCSVLVQKELAAGEDIARCPSCSLYVQVIYDQVALQLASLFTILRFKWTSSSPLLLYYMHF